MSLLSAFVTVVGLFLAIVNAVQLLSCLSALMGFVLTAVIGVFHLVVFVTVVCLVAVLFSLGAVIGSLFVVLVILGSIFLPFTVCCPLP